MLRKTENPELIEIIADKHQDHAYFDFSDNYFLPMQAKPIPVLNYDIIVDQYSSPQDMVIDGNILIKGDVSGSGKIVSTKGSIHIQGGVTSSSLIAFENIEIGLGVINCQGIQSKAGSIIVGQNIYKGGVISAAKYIEVEGSIYNLHDVISGGYITVKGESLGQFSMSAMEDINIGLAANYRGITSATGNIVIERNIQHAGQITAAKDIIVKGAVTNLKPITTTVGHILIAKDVQVSGLISTLAPNRGIFIGGNLSKYCGPIESKGHIKIYGNIYSYNRIYSELSNITILGSYISNLGKIQTRGNLITPNLKQEVNLGASINKSKTFFNQPRRNHSTENASNTNNYDFL